MSEAALRSSESGHRKALVLGALTVVAYVGAVNRAQPLVWGMAALLLAALAVGFAWPHWLVRRLEVTRRGPLRGVEGETIVLRVAVANRGWLPRYMVEVTDRLPLVGAAAGTPAVAPLVLGQIAIVPGGGERAFDVPVMCEKRGRYRLGPVGLVSGFPLGLLEARRHGAGGRQELVVYPPVFPIGELPLRATPALLHRGGLLLPDGAGSAEFRGLREYRPGDNPRHVHWPSSSRLNTLIVKEFEPLAAASLCLVLDLEAASDVGMGRHSTLEYMVRIAASMAAHACERGMPVRLLGEASTPLDIPAASGDRQYRDVLDALAVVEADGAEAYPAVLARAGAQSHPGENMVVFVMAEGERRQRIVGELAMLRARGAHVLAVVFDLPSFAGQASASGPAALPPGLLELGATVVSVALGDDLAQGFNH